MKTVPLMISAMIKLENVLARLTMEETNAMSAMKDFSDIPTVKDAHAMLKVQKMPYVTPQENVLVRPMLSVTAVTSVLKDSLASLIANVS